MAKTYQNLIDEARETLQDVREPYRYDETLMLNTLNRGLQAVARIRPDAYWNTFTAGTTVVPEVTTGTLSATFPLNMMFYNALLSFVVAWAEIVDDEFTVDGRAAQLFANFKAELITL